MRKGAPLSSEVAMLTYAHRGLEGSFARFALKKRVVAFCFSACSLALFSPPRQAKACLWTEMETEKHLGGTDEAGRLSPAHLAANRIRLTWGNSGSPFGMGARRHAVAFDDASRFSFPSRKRLSDDALSG